MKTMCEVCGQHEAEYQCDICGKVVCQYCITDDFICDNCWNEERENEEKYHGPFW